MNEKMEQPKNSDTTEGSSASDSKMTAPVVDWNDSEMRSTYANVVNASSTREEVSVFFGSNLTWNPTETSKVHVKLTDRMILNPHAAKRLWILLGAVLNQHEKRFGTLQVETGLQGRETGGETGR
ncbi:DUF3467 domain-containing protein [Halomonas lysinitropha]|uniref:DUF3467 domain-containing protein n=1 Tax=Halomonas lysinitropha TaxID=2607506 RepID=A0A5K1I6J4_9GAMM|nr:DUF3467 domain-containing protein [Halomonas lysinitropha]VVZ96986.1 hypothetical protein HALO32_03101 [Halomonas lysinitropha]